MRIARLTPAEAVDLYYRNLLGDNYNQQVGCMAVDGCFRCSQEQVRSVHS